MPRTTITPDNMIGGGEDRFTALKLKLAEMCRVWLPPEPGTETHQPWREWVHQIEAPVIEHGVAKMVTKTRQNGETYPDYATSFVGNPLCLGDFETLKARSVDPDMCPDCEAAQRLGKKDFRPKVRYASICVRYATRAGGVEIASPFSASLAIWAYPAGRAKKLSEIFKTEGKDLCMFDLALGPCEPPEGFQKYDIHALGSRKPAWQEHLDYIRELLTTEGNMPTDEQLVMACGKTTERKYMEEDLRRAEQLWAIAEGTSAGPAATTGAEFNGGTAELGAGLQELLGNAVAGPAALASAAAQAEAAGAVAPGTTADLTSLLTAPAPVAPAPPVAAAPAPVAPPAEAPPAADPFPTVPPPAAEPAGEVVTFKDLLGEA